MFKVVALIVFDWYHKMSTDQSGLSPIQESSTTASVVDVEGSAYDEFELDELFDELKKTHKSSSTSTDTNTDDQFEKIKKSISRLPKIAESDALTEDPQLGKGPLHISSAKQEARKKEGVLNINDPITHKKGPVEVTSAGSKWFDMPKGELTPSVKRDLKIIEQRAALDPKRHYKKGKWKTPEFFQIGTIVEGNTEFYSARLKNKERHSTILESVMYDDDTQKYFKRKYDEIQVKKTSGKKAHYKKVREARRKF